MSLRAGDARGTSALRALVVVGVAGATMCGWVLVRDGAHTGGAGAASCPGCAAAASTAAAHAAASGAPHSDAANDSDNLGGLLGAAGGANAGTSDIRTTRPHTDPPPPVTPVVTPAQMVRYSVDHAGNGAWLAEMRLSDQTATPQHHWTLRFALPDVHMIFSDYGTITEAGDVVTVVGSDKPLPRDGIVRILIDLGERAGAATAPPWPTDCQINQAPCAVTGPTATASPTPTGPTTAPTGTGDPDPTDTTPGDATPR